MTTHHAKTAKGARTRDRMLDSAVVLIPQLGWSAVPARTLAGPAGVLTGPDDLAGTKVCTVSALGSSVQLVPS